jgi:Fe-S-cluster containining protein
MVISDRRGALTVWERDDWKEQAAATLENRLPGAPFIPIRLERAEGEQRDPTTPEGHEYGTVHWACTRITPEGRCGDYENRPQLCRDYQAGSDPLCVMHVPPAAGEGSAHGT